MCQVFSERLSKIFCGHERQDDQHTDDADRNADDCEQDLAGDKQCILHCVFLLTCYISIIDRSATLSRGLQLKKKSFSERVGVLSSLSFWHATAILAGVLLTQYSVLNSKYYPNLSDCPSKVRLIQFAKSSNSSTEAFCFIRFAL